MSRIKRIKKYYKKAIKAIGNEKDLLIEIEEEIKNNIIKISDSLKKHNSDKFYASKNSKEYLRYLIAKVEEGVDLWNDLKDLGNINRGNLNEIGKAAHKGYDGLKAYQSLLETGGFINNDEAINKFKDMMYSVFKDLNKVISIEIKIDKYFIKNA